MSHSFIYHVPCLSHDDISSMSMALCLCSMSMGLMSEVLDAAEAREYLAPHTNTPHGPQGTTWDPRTALNAPKHLPTVLSTPSQNDISVLSIVNGLNTPQRSCQGGLTLANSGHHPAHASGVLGVVGFGVIFRGDYAV